MVLDSNLAYGSSYTRTEMLTPVDQPLDKLDDLAPDEIENMRGWIDHFSNKYIICGKLVNNDAV
ncbi:hypothetical protein HWV62_20818 [Athelia sp. TMB]|nr:hypothetical protein HWV62_20818 [Athelia sp. TMB]